MDASESKTSRDRALQILESLETDVDLIGRPLKAWWLSYLHDQTSRYLDTLEFVARRRPDESILELGSVPGHLTVLLRELGYNVQGVDLDPSRITRVFEKHDVPVARVDIEREPLPFDQGSFDSVLFLELLEHLRINPFHALRETHRVLKPGGHLLLTTPNISPVDRLLFLLGKDYQGDPVEQFGLLEKVGHMGHIRLYATDEVRRMLTHVGFEVTDVAYRGATRGGWKGKVLRLLDPRRGRWREFLFMLARKRDVDTG